MIFRLKIRPQILLQWLQSVELQPWWTDTHRDRSPRGVPCWPRCGLLCSQYSWWRPSCYLFKINSWESHTGCETIERMALTFRYTGETLVDLQGWWTLNRVVCIYAKHQKKTDLLRVLLIEDAEICCVTRHYSLDSLGDRWDPGLDFEWPNLSKEETKL